MISEIKQTKAILERHGISALKKYGQNFLVNPDVVNKVGNLIGEDDVVVEVGCGLGSLTEVLCQKAKKVVGYEIDERMINVLKDTIKYDNFILINDDFLKNEIDDKTTVFVSNLPYYITTQILEKVFIKPKNIKHVIVMMQKEVSNRFINPTSKEYSPINVISQYRGEVDLVCNVKRSSFIPTPNVDSAILHFSIENNDENEDFINFVYQAFSQRRKVLTSNLKEYDVTKQLLEQLGISSSARSEQLSLKQYLQLYERVKNDR